MKPHRYIIYRILSLEISPPRFRRIRFVRRRRVRKIAGAYLWTSAILGSLMFAGLALGLLLDATRPTHPNDGLLYAMMVGTVWIAGIGAVVAILLRKSLVENAINARDKESIGFAVNVAAESLLPPYRSDEEVSKNSQMAQKTLLYLLPQLQENDTSLLTARQYDTLCRLLTSYIAPPELVIAILKALEQIGDSTAIPYVEALIERELTLEDNEEVRQAAQECLPFLVERAKQKGVADVLLRASQPHVPTDTLLRPAVSQVSDESTQELLRAAESSKLLL